MQHVLRCWERQSDGTEYKKTLRRPELRPGPRSGSLQRSRKPPKWWGGADCPLPKNAIPALGPSGLASPTPHSKISSDAVATSYMEWGVWLSCSHWEGQRSPLRTPLQKPKGPHLPLPGYLDHAAPKTVGQRQIIHLPVFSSGLKTVGIFQFK